MSERRTVKTVLQYEVDQQSVRNAQASADAVERSLKGIDTDFSRLGSKVNSRVGQLRDGFRDSIRTVKDELELVQGVLGSGGNNTNRPFLRVSQIGREVRALPAVGLGGNLSTDALGKIAQTGGIALDKLGVSIGQLGKGVAAATVLTVGFVLVIDQLNKTFAGGQRILTAALEAQNNYYRALQESTSAQIALRVNQLNEERAILEQQRAELANAIQASASGITEGFAPLEGLALVLGKSPINQLNDQVTALDAQIAANEQTVTRYNQGLELNAFLTNDLAAQEAARATDAAQHLQDRSNAEAATLQFLATATKEATNARVAAANAEINRLLDLNAELQASGGETAEKLIALNNQRILEQQYIRDTTTELRNAADVRNDQRNAFRIVEGVFGDGIDRFTQGLGSVGENFERLQPAFETISKITQEQVESAAKLDQIARQQSDAEAKALSDRDRGRIEAQYQLDRDLEEQERGHRARLLEINRRANATIANSIGARDALAAFLAQQNRREETREENRNNKEAIRSLNLHFKEQQRVIDQRYNEQLAAARSAAQRAAEIERARLQLQVDALNQQLQNQQAASNAYLQINAATNQTILQGAVNLQSQLANLWGVWDMNAAATQAAIDYAAYQQSLGLTATGGGRAYGGAVNSGQRVLVGEHGPEIAYFRSPAMVMSNRASRSMGGGDMPITLNMVGKTDAQIARTAGREVELYINRLLKAQARKQGRQL